MCFHYKAAYATCPTHVGQAYFFPCASPQTCWPEWEAFIRLEQCSDIGGSCVDLPDFCPQCLQTGGTFGDSLSDEARSRIANHSLYRDFHVYDSIIKKMRERVETNPTTILSAHNDEITDKAEHNLIVILRTN